MLLNHCNHLKKHAHGKWLYSVFFMTVFILCSSPAYATCTGTDCECMLEITPVAFGNYDPMSNTPLTAIGNVKVTCTSTDPGEINYTVTWGMGNSSTYDPRFMNSLGNQMNYNLYTDNNFTSIWGDGSNDTAFINTTVPISSVPFSSDYGAFGQIPALQSLPAGTYMDNVEVTVTW